MIGKGQPKKRMKENSELKRMQERARRFRLNKDKFKVQKLAENFYHFEVKLTNC